MSTTNNLKVKKDFLICCECSSTVRMLFTTDDKHYVAPSSRPQLRILEPDPHNREAYVEVSRDALTIRGYQSCRCGDYSLGESEGGSFDFV